MQIRFLKQQGKLDKWKKSKQGKKAGSRLTEVTLKVLKDDFGSVHSLNKGVD